MGLTGLPLGHSSDGISYYRVPTVCPGPHATSFTHRTCLTHRQPSDAEITVPILHKRKQSPQATQQDPPDSHSSLGLYPKAILLHLQITTLAQSAA